MKATRVAKAMVRGCMAASCRPAAAVLSSVLWPSCNAENGLSVPSDSRHRAPSQEEAHEWEGATAAQHRDLEGLEKGQAGSSAGEGTSPAIREDEDALEAAESKEEAAEKAAQGEAQTEQFGGTKEPLGDKRHESISCMQFVAFNLYSPL